LPGQTRYQYLCPETAKVNYYVLLAVFTHPEVVGVIEARTREKFGKSIQCHRTTQQDEQVMILVVDGNTK
jgi:hypothetical protein